MEKAYVRLEPCAKFPDRTHGATAKCRPSVAELESKRHRTARRSAAVAAVLAFALGWAIGCIALEVGL